MNFINSLPMWMILVPILVMALIASVAGYRYGRRHIEAGTHSNISGLRASTIGIVALLLAFSFSMTSSRFGDRSRTVLEEANSIGTCYLRAGLLDNPARDRIRNALRTYTDSRLENYQKGVDSKEYLRTTLAMHAALDELWSGVEQAVHQDQERARVSVIVPAANDVIDLSGKHSWSDHNQMPAPVVFLLAATIIIASVLIGQSLAESGQRHIGLWLALNILLVLVIFVILDFDRPLRGLIRMNQAPLVDVRESMK
jgi:uncharacterized protein (DUF983 family)